MPRGYKACLRDILEAISKIERYIEEMSFEDFSQDDLIKDGIARNLEIIGEAVKNIPDEIKKKNYDLEWKKIAGLRGILIHTYFGIDVEIVWDIVKNKIPSVKEKIMEMFTQIKE